VTGSFDGTRVLKLSVEGEAGDEEADIEELEDVEPFVGEGATGTLLAANVGDLLVNVTAQAALFASSSPGDGGKGSWKPEDGKKKILAAVARDGRLALAIEGGAVVILEAKDGQLAQVGCVSSSLIFPLTLTSLTLTLPEQDYHLRHRCLRPRALFFFLRRPRYPRRRSLDAFSDRPSPLRSLPFSRRTTHPFDLFPYPIACPPYFRLHFFLFSTFDNPLLRSRRRFSHHFLRLPQSWRDRREKREDGPAGEEAVVTYGVRTEGGRDGGLCCE
jgi:hypothetical protein